MDLAMFRKTLVESVAKIRFSLKPGCCKPIRPHVKLMF